MKIQKLPPEARTKLESGVIVADIVQCVLELVRNSLDADASGIAVRLDLKNFHIKVIDNGKGIRKDDLELVGEKYMTSKHQSLNNSNVSRPNYGYRGLALSCILDFCESLTIKTKPQNSDVTLLKVFVKGKAIQMAELKDKVCGTGTTVIIEDFMCTMPIRRKKIKDVFEMEEIKAQLQYMALIHYNVCFTLRNESKGLILLQTPQALNMLEMISNLFGKGIASRLKPLKYEENGYSITGFVSMKLTKQNNIQIVYLNRQMITKGVIHKFIINVMKEYSGNKTLLSDSPAEQILRKLKNSHHTFVIEIKCPHNYYELFTTLKKTTVEFKNWKDILKCIHRGLRKAYKFDCEKLDDSVNNFENDATKFGTSVLVNAVKGVPAKRGFKVRRNVRKGNREISKKATFSETNENNKFIDLEEKKVGECTSDTLETPIPKNLKAIRPEKSNFSKSDIDESHIEFYKWVKASSKTEANAFNLYSEFLQHKNKKNFVTSECYKSPVFGVKLKGKRKSAMESKTAEKKQKTIQKDLDVFTKDIALMVQDSTKSVPNVNLRIKKGVQFNTEVQWKVSEFPNLDCKDWRENDEQIFKKPVIASRSQTQLEMIQSLSSPASSEMHFTNIIKFRNLPETLHIEKDSLLPPEEELYTNTWMSHYQDEGNNNFLHSSNIIQNSFKCGNGKSIKFRDVTIQTSCLEMPQKMNALVQTSQTIPESIFGSEPDRLINEVPIPDFWNTSTSGSKAFCDLNKIYTPKTDDQNHSVSCKFVCSQMPNSRSNPKSDTETQTLRHLWTDSLSVFGNPADQSQDLKTPSDSVPKTILLEQLCSPQFCIIERHDFIPKGLSPPKVSNSKAVEIPILDSPERNRIQITIHDVKNDLLTVKWLDESTGKCAKPEIPDALASEMEINTVRKCINFERQILSASLSFCAVKVHNLLHSFTLSKELLSSVEVLGQLDEKFIVTKMKVSLPKNMMLIVLLDQHAVDERIKLEEIINEYTIADKFISAPLKHSLELTFSKSQVQVLMDLTENMTAFGFDIKPKNQETVLVNCVPSFFFDKLKKKNEKESFLKDILQTVIIGILSEVTETRGVAPKIPKILHDAFSSEACHSAVKFNKALSKETMSKMISDLKNCKLPFQCAHGRPSVIPIIDLEDFSSEEEESIDLQKILKFLRGTEAP